MSSQADALGQLTCGPIIGAVGTIFGLRAATVAASVLLSPALLYARTQRMTTAPLPLEAPEIVQETP